MGVRNSKQANTQCNGYKGLANSHQEVVVKNASPDFVREVFKPIGLIPGESRTRPAATAGVMEGDEVPDPIFEGDITGASV